MRALVVLLASLALACDGPTDPPDAGPPDAGPACTFEPGAPEEIPEPAVRTARWAFEPWISKDISDRDDAYAFVDGFLERDIPVGALVIDSPWDEHYTTFRPNPSRYPDFPEMVEDMHARDVRVLLWVTQMVNRNSFDAEATGDRYIGPSPNFAEGCACGFFVEDCTLFNWWKGRGAGVDFFHPDARAWWHQQQDLVLDAGIDGWKLDFGESYLEEPEELVVEETRLTTHEGEVSLQRYSEEYYRDYLAYGRHRRGPDFVTMVRAWDESYDRRGRFYARPEHAPVAWMGDNHRDWEGLADALDHTFRSAAAGYVVLGTDIGGYLDRDEDSLTQVIPFDVEVFQRWVAIGGLSPFMQLHGRANLAPWTVEERVEETIALYRYWATLHHEMVGFWYSLAEEAYASGGVIVHPIGEEAEWAGDYRYVIGEHLLVAPILAAGDARDVALPADARWYDWWDPAGDALDGGQTLEDYAVVERVRVPLFVREGAILPVDVESDVTGLGTAASAGHLTVLAWPDRSVTSFTLHETDGEETGIHVQRASDGAITMTLSRAVRPVILRLRAEAAPSAVEAGASIPEVSDLDAASAGWRYDASARWLWVKLEASADPITLTTTP